METTKVYLSGGFHSMWRDKVKEALEGFKFFDPGDNREDHRSVLGGIGGRPQGLAAGVVHRGEDRVRSDRHVPR